MLFPLLKNQQALAQTNVSTGPEIEGTSWGLSGIQAAGHAMDCCGLFGQMH